MRDGKPEIAIKSEVDRAATDLLGCAQGWETGNDLPWAVHCRRAYAKVNLMLSVGPPLPAGDARPGMHPIASWMHAVDLFDDVEVEPARQAGLDVSWAKDAPRPSAIDWSREKDLVWRALGVLERSTACALPARIRVVKRIPVGGGLGGGSSDAAAALLALSEAFGLGLSVAQLAVLSRELGSDVAFFLDERPGPPRPPVVAGRGVRIARLEPSAGWVVLIFPAFGSPTGPVYTTYDALGPKPLREGDVAHVAAANRIDAGLLFNDLLAPAEALQPRLHTFRERIGKAAELPVCMSGSGSTLFIPASGSHQAGWIQRRIIAGVPEAATLAARLV
jgi:4-diphosphocytidyl-2-C-methyl-D-erythritol kinase